MFAITIKFPIETGDIFRIQHAAGIQVFIAVVSYNYLILISNL